MDGMITFENYVVSLDIKGTMLHYVLEQAASLGRCTFTDGYSSHIWQSKRYYNYTLDCESSVIPIRRVHEGKSNSNEACAGNSTQPGKYIEVDEPPAAARDFPIDQLGVLGTSQKSNMMGTNTQCRRVRSWLDHNLPVVF